MVSVIGITGYKYSGKDTIADYLCKNYGFTKLAFAGILKVLCQMLFGLSYEQLHGNQKETPIEKWWGLSAREILQYVGTEIVRNHMSELHQDIQQNFWIICVMNIIKSNNELPQITNKNPIMNVISLLFNINENDYHTNKCMENWYNLNAHTIYTFIEHIFGEHMKLLHPNFDNFWNKCENVYENICFGNGNMALTDNNVKKYVISDVRFPNESDAIKKIGGNIIRVTRHGLNSHDNHESEKYVNMMDVTLEIENNSSINVLYDKIDNFMVQ